MNVCALTQQATPLSASSYCSMPSVRLKTSSHVAGHSSVPSVHLSSVAGALCTRGSEPSRLGRRRRAICCKDESADAYREEARESAKEAKEAIPQNASDLEAVIDQLMERYSDDPAQINHIRRNVAALIQFSFSLKQIIQIYLENSDLLHRDLSDNIKTIRDCLCEQGMDKAEFVDAVISYPLLLSEDPAKLKDAMEYFTVDVGVRNFENFFKPEVYPFHEPLSTIKSRLKYLEEIGLYRLDFMLENYPIVLSYSKEKVDLNFSHFKNLLGRKDGALLLSRIPALFVMNPEVLDNAYKNLLPIFGEGKSKYLLKKAPYSVFVSWPLVWEKIFFVHYVMEIDLDQIWKNPTVLTFSLEKRIKPRLITLKKLGLIKNHKLAYILCLNDEDFFAYFGVVPVLLLHV